MTQFFKEWLVSYWGFCGWQFSLIYGLMLWTGSLLCVVRIPIPVHTRSLNIMKETGMIGTTSNSNWWSWLAYPTRFQSWYLEPHAPRFELHLHSSRGPRNGCWQTQLRRIRPRSNEIHPTSSRSCESHYISSLISGEVLVSRMREKSARIDGDKYRATSRLPHGPREVGRVL